MSWHHLFDWLPSRTLRRTRRAPTPSPLPCWRFVVPRLERLESRIAPAIVTPFTPIFSQNATGDIAVIGNTLETASTVNNPGRTQANVTAAQNGTGPNVNNNNWNMAYVDVDNDPTTFNSSQSALNLPAGATVLFAGLYWGSVTTTPAQAAARNTIQFSSPTSGGYVSLTGTTIGSTTFTGAPSGTIYESFANVTSLVQAAGNGTYEVANVQAALRDAQGNLEAGTYAGWSLVVAYSAPGAPARNLTVFNGFAVQASTDPALNIPINGFVAPPAGPVNAKVGVVAYEGDLGTTGDSMALNGKQLSDAVTPANNFFNSGISNLGVLQTAKNPNFVNQMGFDAKVVNAPSGSIPNSATSANITLTTSGDGYFPGVVTTAIDLFAPNLVATKSVADITGGNSLPGDTLEYTVNVTNTGQDPAGNVILTDPIPANTTYVPGSLRILTGANAGIMTDAAGDDQAFFDTAHNQVVFDLGAGATAGGTLGIGASTSIRFRVQVNPGVAANTVIPNQATINYKGVTTGFPFTSLSTAPAFTVANSVADVALAKTVSNPTPNVGDNVTFTVTATNSGPGPATGVNVFDLLPPGLQLANAITSQGEYDGGTGLWTIGSLANGGVATLTILATVLSPSPQTNTATVSRTDSVDPNASNNQASATETPQLADLSVKKTVSNPTPNVGDTITYSVTVTNNGPNNATNVAVTDLLPAGLTFLSSSVGAAYNSATGLWTVGALANGTSAVLTITAIVASPQATLNAATISHADQFDPNTSNNRAAAAVTPQQADLALGKTVSDIVPPIGGIVTYTITLNNDGPDQATGVQVTDPLPSGVTFQSANPPAGTTFDPTTGVWNVGTIAVRGQSVLTITVVVNTPDAIQNTATISHADQFDPNTANNTATSNIEALDADLQMLKFIEVPNPNVGDLDEFDLGVVNNGPADATNIVVHDPLPAGLTLIAANPFPDGSSSYDPTTGLWTIPFLASGDTAALFVIFRVDSPDPVLNTATITSLDQIDPNLNNNTASAGYTPQQADLQLAKTVDNPTPNVGDTVTFTVTLSDNGPDPATNVAVNDPLPTGLSLISATPSEGTYDGGVWNVGTIDPSLSQTLTITALVVSPNPQTNFASISHSDQFDPDPTNNTASATETPQQADLQVKKVVDRIVINVGDPIVYTITVTNAGPNNATDVQLTDPLPSGVSFAFDTPSQGSYDPTTGLWDVGTMANGANAVLQIHGVLVSPDPQLNTATITHSDQFDPNPGNNSSTAVLAAQQADLQVSKSVSNPTPNVGDVITYTINLTNNGPDPATTVTVNDLLPADVSFISALPSVGTYDHTTGVWTVGTVNVGAPQTLTITAQVINDNPSANTASVGHSDVFDPNPNNNSNSASVNPEEADLALFKTVDNFTPNVGDVISYTLTLKDTGPNDATNVQVTDVLPAGLTFVNDIPSEGSYNAATGIWTVGTVTTTTPQTLTITARVVSSNPQTNTANITHSDQFDPDLNNNSGSATLTPQQADLSLTKTVDNPTPNVGDTVTFTITLANQGPDTATNVAVDDPLPAGLAFVSSALSQGTYDNTSGVWTVGTLDSSAPAQLLIRATVIGPQQETNTALIGHSDQFDSDPGNNESGATVTPQQADLVVGKQVSNPTPNVDDTITYTVTVANDGPNTATGVTLQDILPGQVRFQSFLASQGSYDPNTNTWTVGPVGVGATQTLTITVLVTSANPATNTASISHVDQFDPDASNNSDTASINPRQADLELTKFVSDPTPNVGNTVNFIIALTNNGPDDATGVQVTDPLPAGLAFVSASPSQGDYNSGTGVWTVGIVTTTDEPTLQIQAKVVSPNAETNTATVSADQVDPDPGNDSAGATVTPQHADLAVTKEVDVPTPNVGEVVHFTVAVNNVGPDAATNVTLGDLLPAGLTFVSATPSEGTYNPTTGAWAVGTVDTTTAQTLTIAARVTGPSPATNTTAVIHSDQFNPNPANTSASATYTPQQAHLFVTKIVSDPSPNMGQTVTFLVTVGNNGPDMATGVQVSDLLPAGLSLVLATPNQGTYNSGTGVWTVGTLGNGGAATLQVLAVVVSPNAETNTATLSHADQFDPDSGNNQASSTVTPPTPPPPPPPAAADVSLTKQVSQSNPIFGTAVTYTLLVHNNGPGSATGIVATDTLPAGLVFITATASQGSFDPGSGVWFIGTLPSSATATLQITGPVAAIGPITNTAGVAALEGDPDLANNVSSVTIDGMLSAAQVSKLSFLSSSDGPSNAAVLAAEEAILNALMPMLMNTWHALLSVAQSLLAARNDPGPSNGGIAVFKGNWLGSSLVVYENPFAGQVTAVQVGAFDLLFENNTVAGLRLS